MRLTKAQQRLLVAMHKAGPYKAHSVLALGSRLPMMMALKRAGLAEQTANTQVGLWRGRLTKLGRQWARKLRKAGLGGAEVQKPGTALVVR